MIYITNNKKHLLLFVKGLLTGSFGYSNVVKLSDSNVQVDFSLFWIWNKTCCNIRSQFCCNVWVSKL